MNKKLLGIAAVALLGVSAAFAATTSTVYFTASGNLTKYIAPLDPSNEQDKQSGESDHSNDLPAGVSKVYSTIGTDATSVKAISKGETLTSGSIGVKYSKNGKTVNPSSDSTYVSNAPYIYHELYVSGMEFSQKGDLYLIPVNFTNFHENDLTMDVYWSSSDSKCYYTDYKTLTVTDTTNTSLTSSLLRYRFIHYHSTTSTNKNYGGNITLDMLSKFDGSSNTTQAKFLSLSWTSIDLWYLEIELSDNYTGSSTLTFNNARIEAELL